LATITLVTAPLLSTTLLPPALLVAPTTHVTALGACLAGGSIFLGCRCGSFIAGGLLLSSGLIDRRVNHPASQLYRRGAGHLIWVLLDKHCHSE
jgi:hypothetical protein